VKVFHKKIKKIKSNRNEGSEREAEKRREILVSLSTFAFR
jgi:hypothetical protein